MSAESPRKSVTDCALTVAPQPVSDRSIIESVAGFINEVVPQAYTNLPAGDSKETIAWARFEQGDINDPSLYPDNSTGTASLLLVLGYGTGVQVWAIPASGEATEVLSWRQGVVRTLRILPTPRPGPDSFSHKRPLVALCDSAGPGPQFCSLSFISLKAGDQVKSIKFKNPVSDVLANQRSVVVTFPERIAVFDAGTLEDRLTVTTCYPCPGPNPNPVALGSRWLAYCERRLVPTRRSSGGREGEGVQSYTAAVLHAAQTFGRGLRGLGETVASSLSRGSPGPPPPVVGADGMVPGVVTVMDAQAAVSAEGATIAHFPAHSEPVVALEFDPSGMLLLTADKRGHDFHLFRIQPHPGGPSLAAVHHLYTLHRGDTTAKVQDIAFAADSRWVAVSTMRGTTHVFPITPYGGAVGIRTHATPHVVNRLSRFHRSAGLTAEGRSSPIPMEVAPPAMPYPNPRLPPYPHPTVLGPLAQVRQRPPPSPAQPAGRNAAPRRLPSVGEEGAPPLRVAACFAPPRAWLGGSPRESSSRSGKRLVDALFVAACQGALVEYELEPRHAAGIPKEKVCDDTSVELEVRARAQWPLLRGPGDVQPPLSQSNPLMGGCDRVLPGTESGPEDERWLSQVEIVTHAGPHRRLWMGPQFTFKTYTANVGGPLFSLEMDAVEVGIGSSCRPARSNPVNMPVGGTGARPLVPVLIESSSGSYDQSPRLLEAYGGDGGDSDSSVGPGETQLREDLADAMMESPGVPSREAGRRVIVEMRSKQPYKRNCNPIEKIVNPVGTVITVSVPSEEESGAVLPLDSVSRGQDVVSTTTSRQPPVEVIDHGEHLAHPAPTGVEDVRKFSHATRDSKLASWNDPFEWNRNISLRSMSPEEEKEFNSNSRAVSAAPINNTSARNKTTRQDTAVLIDEERRDRNKPFAAEMCDQAGECETKNRKGKHLKSVQTDRFGDRNKDTSSNQERSKKDALAIDGNTKSNYLNGKKSNSILQENQDLPDEVDEAAVQKSMAEQELCKAVESFDAAGDTLEFTSATQLEDCGSTVGCTEDVQPRVANKSKRGKGKEQSASPPKDVLTSNEPLKVRVRKKSRLLKADDNAGEHVNATQEMSRIGFQDDSSNGEVSVPNAEKQDSLLMDVTESLQRNTAQSKKSRRYKIPSDVDEKETEESVCRNVDDIFPFSEIKSQKLDLNENKEIDFPSLSDSFPAFGPRLWGSSGACSRERSPAHCMGEAEVELDPPTKAEMEAALVKTPRSFQKEKSTKARQSKKAASNKCVMETTAECSPLKLWSNIVSGGGSKFKTVEESESCISSSSILTKNFGEVPDDEEVTVKYTCGLSVDVDYEKEDPAESGLLVDLPELDADNGNQDSGSDLVDASDSRSSGMVTASESLSMVDMAAELSNDVATPEDEDSAQQGSAQSLLKKTRKAKKKRK